VASAVSVLFQVNTPSDNGYGGESADWEDGDTVSGRIGNRNPAPGGVLDMGDDVPYRKVQYVAFDKPFTPDLPSNLQLIRLVAGGKTYRVVDRTDYEKSVQFLVETVS
jgi:hypothetical protein